MSVKKIVVSAMATNCYIYKDEATGRGAVIDPGEMTNELKAAIEGYGTDKFDYILLTHCHFDHVGGVSAVKELTGAPVGIHEYDAAGLLDSNLNVSAFFTQRFRYTPADVTFADGQEIMVGETAFKVMHTPGHSEGSCCYITEGIIFSGDTLFKRAAGRFDMPGGNYTKLKKSLKSLAALQGDFVVYPGHDMITTLSQERMYNLYF